MTVLFRLQVPTPDEILRNGNVQKHLSSGRTPKECEEREFKSTFEAPYIDGQSSLAQAELKNTQNTSSTQSKQEQEKIPGHLSSNIMASPKKTKDCLVLAQSRCQIQRDITKKKSSSSFWTNFHHHVPLQNALSQ